MRRILLTGTAGALALATSAVAALGQPAPSQPNPDSADDLTAQDGEWAGYAHVGYHLDPHWRLELQGGYHAGDASHALASSGGLNPCVDPLASLACNPHEVGLGAYSMMANLVFDAAPDNRWVDPFFAVGAGVDRFDAAPIALANPAAPFMPMGQGAAALSYQAMIGLAFRPHDRLHFDLSYRWMSGMAPALNGQPTALGDRFQDQTVAVTVRYALAMPKAAIAPTPSFGLASSAAALTPVVPRAGVPRMVVVDTVSDPSALSGEAEAAVGQTDLSASEGRGAQVVVEGHADTTSAAAYNLRLTERRAKAMADAMVSLGVPSSAIDVRWAGSDSEMAPTDDLALQDRVGPPYADQQYQVR